MAIIIIIICGFVLFSSQFQNILPVTQVSPPEPTPAPIANVILSPNNQVVVLSLGQIPSFSLTITQNGYGTVIFPCSVTIVPSVQVTSHDSYSIPILDNYGTINTSPIESWVLLPSQPETISYYAVIQDSTGAKITSNTVTVDYK